MSAADAKMDIAFLVRSLKSSMLSSNILSSTSFQKGKYLLVKQSRRKAGMVAQGDGKFDPRG